MPRANHQDAPKEPAGGQVDSRTLFPMNMCIGRGECCMKSTRYRSTLCDNGIVVTDNYLSVYEQEYYLSCVSKILSNLNKAYP